MTDYKVRHWEGRDLSIMDEAELRVVIDNIATYHDYTLRSVMRDISNLQFEIDKARQTLIRHAEDRLYMGVMIGGVVGLALGAFWGWTL